MSVVALATVGAGLAAADWSAAKSKVEEFRRQYQDAKKMTPEETRRIVTAICEADENDELKKADSSVIKDLVKKNPDFAKCKRFEGRIDCYRLCPSIDEDGSVREQNANWRQDCS